MMKGVERADGVLLMPLERTRKSELMIVLLPCMLSLPSDKALASAWGGWEFLCPEWCKLCKHMMNHLLRLDCCSSEAMSLKSPYTASIPQQELRAITYKTPLR